MIAPKRVIPKHVAACQHSPDKRNRWNIWTWNRSHPEVQTRIPYSCNSWRCDVCRRHEAAVTFARIRQAQEQLDPAGWCFLVLTLDRLGFYGGKPWLDVNEAYRSLGEMSRKTLRAIGYVWGPETRLERSGGGKELRTVRALGNRWVAVVEAHRSGWPHLNLMIWCPDLARELASERDQRLEQPELADAVALAREAWSKKEPVTPAIREKARAATVVGGELEALLIECGWGKQSTAEAARSVDAVAGYIVKLAGNHDASVGELAKITQAPTNAPIRFRRLRSGKGFLPPRHSNPDVTGCLIRARRSGQGDWDIAAVNAPKDETQHEYVQRARAAEMALIFEEEAILSRTRGRLPAMPPMRVAFAGKLESHIETSERRSALLRRALDACG